MKHETEEVSRGLVITHVVEEGLVFLLEVEEVVEQTSVP